MKGIVAGIVGFAVIVAMITTFAAPTPKTFAGKRVMLDEEPWWAKPDVADKTLQRVKEAGFNVYRPNVWHGRGTTWPSNLAPWDPWLKDLPKAGYDPLKELIRKAHAMGLEVHPWFNVVLRQSDLRPELALPGEEHKDEGAFDVHNPIFREWISDIIAEVAANYDVDGINLDYIRAVMLCKSEVCAQKYREKYGRSLEADAVFIRTWSGRVPTLVEFQEEAVTMLVKMISDKVRAVKPNIMLSVDAIPDLAGPDQGQNSIRWANEGLIDVLFRMDYFLNIDTALTDSIRKRLRNPDSLSVLISNISMEERKPDQPYFSRSGKWLADTVSLIQQRWPNTGTAIYFYKSLSDEQIAALKAGPFKVASGQLQYPGGFQVR